MVISSMISNTLVLALLINDLPSSSPQIQREVPLPSSITDETMKLLTLFRKEFVPVTPGTDPFPARFIMGRDDGPLEEKPAHQVQFASAFEIARYEVPQNLWENIMGNNPSKWKGPRNSVEMISYDDALRFCEKVTTVMRQAKLIRPTQLVRLPTESEWEYCARAGTTTRYSFGDDAQALDKFGWYRGNAAGNDPPVGAKQPNPWHLYDIHGYLWEWCLDSFHEDYAEAPADGSAWISNSDLPHVLRGGSWKDPAERLTSSYRRAASKNLLDDAVGLRCILATEP